MKQNNYSFIFLITLSFIIETISISLLIIKYPNYYESLIKTILIGHVLSVIIATWGIFISPKNRKVWLFSFIILLSIPLIGYIIVYQILNKQIDVKTPELYNEYQSHILYGTETTYQSRRLKKSYDYLKNGVEIEPARDAIEGANFIEKLGLIRNLGRVTSRTSVNVLKNLLEDSNMDIRYYAGEQIANIAEHYNIFINELKKNIQSDPHNYKLYLEIGTLYIEYAFCGLFEEKSIEDEIENAIASLKQSLKLNPRQFESHFLLGRIYMYYGDYTQASEYFENSLAIRNNDFSGFLGLAECEWQNRNFEKFNEYIKKLEKNIDTYEDENKPRIIESIHCWRMANDK